MKHLLCTLLLGSALGLTGCASNPPREHVLVTYPIVNVVCIGVVAFHTTTGVLLRNTPGDGIFVQTADKAIVKLNYKNCVVHRTGKTVKMEEWLP